MKHVLKFAQSLPIVVRRELATVPDYTFHQWVIGPVRWEYSCEVDVSDVREFVTDGKLIVIPANPLAIVSHAASLMGVTTSSVSREGDRYRATAGIVSEVREDALMAACTLLERAVGMRRVILSPAAPRVAASEFGWTVKPKGMVQ